jgi:hypothetical protein
MTASDPPAPERRPTIHVVTCQRRPGSPVSQPITTLRRSANVRTRYFFQAAGKIGIDFTYLTKIERGARKPGRVVAVKIEGATAGAVPVASWDQAPSTKKRKVAA